MGLITNKLDNLNKNTIIMDNDKKMIDPFLPVDEQGYYGRFGGAYVPEILHANVENLKKAFEKYADDP